tara:strand:- start:231 stop:467 length:237 start_codon:yes stop_codon:yes gene_type:complete
LARTKRRAAGRRGGGLEEVRVARSELAVVGSTTTTPDDVDDPTDPAVAEQRCRGRGEGVGVRVGWVVVGGGGGAVETS